MKSISRDEVLRWVSGPKSQGGSGVGGGSVDFAGYATQIWTEQNYVGKEFFSSLFKAYDANGNEVLPNDTETTIDNIKAMFGFWTDFYVSALGTGGQSSLGIRLAQLADVNVAGVQNDQVLKYDATSQKWVPGTVSSGTDMATVWLNLAASGNQQINASHLTTALASYATQTWVGQQGYITSSAISDMATKTWVGQNYLPLAGGTITGSLTVNNTLSTGGNATVGGDLTVNGGDLTVNEPNSSGASAIWFQSGGTTYGNLRVKSSNGEFYFYQGSAGDGQSSVCVNAGWFYSYGQVTALSDVRDKNVVDDVSLSIEQIASAPAIRFTWNDGRDDKSMQAGSIAQYWHKVLPEVIREKDDRLSLSYGVAALVSSIITARKVVDHEHRIAELERENKELKLKLKIA